MKKNKIQLIYELFIAITARLQMYVINEMNPTLMSIVGSREGLIGMKLLLSGLS